MNEKYGGEFEVVNISSGRSSYYAYVYVTNKEIGEETEFRVAITPTYREDKNKDGYYDKYEINGYGLLC